MGTLDMIRKIGTIKYSLKMKNERIEDTKQAIVNLQAELAGQQELKLHLELSLEGAIEALVESH
jgi:hypothetical protein